MKFSNEFIDDVREANNIVDVISEYLVLKQNGNNFWACCPFHNEKTPSFSVARDKGFFYCFGCHASGDVFKFVMMKENISFPDAVVKLAERAHIAIPETEKTPEDEEKEKFLQHLYLVNEMASKFFHNCLIKTSYGKVGIDYFHNRHLTDKTIDEFLLGFAPDSWDKLTNAFLKKGIAGETLVTLGLAKEKNGHYYDAFRNRVMFPIMDARGRVVGFGGRVLDNSTPKYLNSPETPIFNKRRLLFAMDKAHKAIYEKGYAVLVEGYMDVIAAHNHGVCNVVASLGTAFTGEQARLLQRQAKKLVLSYDMDTAGRNATLRAMDIVKPLGMKIRVASLPRGKDPDEFINSMGADAFIQTMEEAPGVLDYMLQTALHESDPATLEGKATITAKIMPALAAVNNQIVLEGFIEKLARTIKIDANAIRTEFNKYIEHHPGIGTTPVTISTEVMKSNAFSRRGSKLAVAEENIIRFLIEHPASFEKIYNLINPEYFTNELRQGIYGKLIDTYYQQPQYTLSDIQENLAPEEASELARIMVLQDVPVDENALMDYVKHFQLTALQKAYEDHSKKASDYSRTGDTRFIKELAECKKIREAMKQWN